MGLKTLDERLLTGKDVTMNFYVADTDRYKNKRDIEHGISFPDYVTVQLKGESKGTQVGTREVRIADFNSPTKGTRSWRLFTVRNNTKNCFMPSQHNLLGGRGKFGKIYYWVPLIFDEDTGKSLLLLFTVDWDDLSVKVKLEEVYMSVFMQISTGWVEYDTSVTGRISTKVAVRLKKKCLTGLQEALGLNADTMNKLAAEIFAESENLMDSMRFHLGDALYGAYSRATNEEYIEAALVFQNEDDLLFVQEYADEFPRYTPVAMYDAFGNKVGYTSRFKPRTESLRSRYGYSMRPDVILRLQKGQEPVRLNFIQSDTRVRIWLVLGLDGLLSGVDEQEVERLWRGCNNYGPVEYNGVVNFLISADLFINRLSLFIQAIRLDGVERKEFKRLHTPATAQCTLLATRTNKAGKVTMETYSQSSGHITLSFKEFIENIDTIMGAIEAQYDKLGPNKMCVIDLLDTDDINDISNCVAGYYTSLRLAWQYTQHKTKGFTILAKLNTDSDCVGGKNTISSDMVLVESKVGDYTKLKEDLIAQMEGIRKRIVNIY